MTDHELLELADAYGIVWGIGADTGRPRVVYVLAGLLQVVDVEIAPSECEVRIDPVSALRRAIAQAIEQLTTATN